MIRKSSLGLIVSEGDSVYANRPYINGGIKTGQADLIYKCNKYPMSFFTIPLPLKLRVIRLHFPLDKYNESWYIKIVIIL